MERKNRLLYRNWIYVALFVGMLGAFSYFYDIKCTNVPAAELPNVDVVNYSVDTSNEATDTATKFDRKTIIPVGMPIGIYVKTEGVMVVNVGEVTGADGKKYSPCEGRIETGDYITAINGTEINDKKAMTKILNDCNENVTLTIKRGNGEFYVAVKSVKDVNGRNMLGVWVKDDISGIGTLTYITDTEFGALGHSINDNDTGTFMEISDGAIFPAEIINIRKPETGKPGRLEGLINFKNQNILGWVVGNSGYGINGRVTDNMKDFIGDRKAYPVATSAEIREGTAYIMSYVSGKEEMYEIEIKNTAYSNLGNVDKGFEIEIKDERLVDITGGIVQGMSGSPIIQDGRVIGAVTHVLVDDPTRGYAIFIEEMLEDN